MKQLWQQDLQLQEPNKQGIIRSESDKYCVSEGIKLDRKREEWKNAGKIISCAPMALCGLVIPAHEDISMKSQKFLNFSPRLLVSTTNVIFSQPDLSFLLLDV